VRIAFYIILAANLLFMGWAVWIDSPQPNTQDALSRLPRLQLVTDAPAPFTKPDSGAAQKMVYREPVPALSCLSVGPFNDMTIAARTARMLLDQGFKPQQRAEEGEILDGYWVYVGGMQGDAEVADVAQRLEANGFTDAHVMKESPQGRRISVGLFTEHAGAERRAKAVQHLGLQPEITERKFPGTVYWVDVSLPPGMHELPTQDLVADGGRVIRVGMQACPPGPSAQPAERTSPQPVIHEPAEDDQDDGIVKSLPRTTVASAPKRP
jgi:hypothetical protein